MALSLNERADGGPLPIGGRIGGGKVMSVVLTKKFECLPHLPLLQL